MKNFQNSTWSLEIYKLPQMCKFASQSRFTSFCFCLELVWITDEMNVAHPFIQISTRVYGVILMNIKSQLRHCWGNNALVQYKKSTLDELLVLVKALKNVKTINPFQANVPFLYPLKTSNISLKWKWNISLKWVTKRHATDEKKHIL